MSKLNTQEDDTVLQNESELLLLQEILALTLFAGTELPLALLDEAVSTRIQVGLPDNCLVFTNAGSSAYLQQLAKILDDEQSEYLFLWPPFIASEDLPQKLKAQFPGLGLHEIVVQIVLERAPSHCRIGAILPRGFFINQSSLQLRTAVTSTATPNYIVSFAERSPGKEQKTVQPQINLFILENQMLDEKLVRFFQCPKIPDLVSEVGERQPNQERIAAIVKDLKRLKRQGGGPTEFGFILREGLPSDSPWIYARHHPNYQRRLDDLRLFGDVQALGDLADMFLGFRASEQVNLLVPGGESSKGIPVIEAVNIGLDNRLTYQETRYRALGEKVSAYQLQAGDICLRNNIASDNRAKAVLIEEEMLPLAANQSVLILRPKVERNVDPYFLTAYLQSEKVVDALRAQGIARRLYEHALAELPVPVQDEELYAALQNLRFASNTIGEWQAEADAALASIFDFSSAKDARAFVLEAGRKVRQRERAGRQIDDISYRLRTGLPHPLAYRWRAAETAPVDRDGYIEVLECAEAAICYLASAALILMKVIQEPIHYLGTLVPRISDPDRRSGTNFGDWVAIVREVNARRALKEQVNAPFYQVARFLDDAALNDALSLLKESRDDQSHGRGPRGTELETSMEQCQQALKTLFEAIEFLSEYSVRYIEETNRDSLSGVTHYRYREMMGDHPLVMKLDAETSTAELEAHSLYLTDRTGEMYLLRPFLSRRHCTFCGGWETFYLDRYDARTGTCILKSLEKGHTIEDDQIAATFRQVSFLE